MDSDGGGIGGGGRIWVRLGCQGGTLWKENIWTETWMAKPINTYFNKYIWYG